MALSRTRASPAACSAWPASPNLLPGATANRGLVVRVGDTVVRPIAPCWPATHALLAHLSAADHWRTVAGTAARARRWCLRYRRDLLAAAR